MNRIPFWYVLKAPPGTPDGYWTPRGAWSPSQRDAQVFYVAPREEERCGARLVRVWARLPAPKLPAWVKPLPLDSGMVAVFRRSGATVREYIFRVNDGGMWAALQYRQSRRGCFERTNGDAAPVDVWTEAALRAGALLRKRAR